MEVSVVVGRQATAVRPELFPVRSRVGDSRVWARARSRVLFPRTSRVGADPACARRLRRVSAIRAVVRSQMVGGAEKKAARARRNTAVRSPQLFVGLPLDVVSDCNTINHAKAIAAGLKALKLLGADGVELPIFWGVVEKESMGKYEWTSYLALAELIRAAGLQIRASLCFHASKTPSIQLPSWVTATGDANPDIYYTDKAGKRQKECLSLAVDDLPVFNGKTPVQVFEDFCQSFQAAFSDFLGSTITEISIGLGPGGELRYPSRPPPSKGSKFVGVGEFQCYDKHMLGQLKQHAEQTGNPLWGLSGPHDAPRYDQSPDSGFFKEHGGSWESAYGNFFLSWYSGQLLAHGDRLLSRASAVFGSSPVTLSAKIPFVHSWYKTRSHPSELTAGYYNTDLRDGYDAVAEMFARNSCKMILRGMDLSDKDQPRVCRCSPESLLSQVTKACEKHGVRVSGENYSASGVANGFVKIKDNILGKRSLVDSFTYQRMGAYFFSPEHWPKFTEFIRGIDRPELPADDLVSEDGGSLSLHTDTVTGSSRQMQAV